MNQEQIIAEANKSHAFYNRFYFSQDVSVDPESFQKQFSLYNAERDNALTEEELKAVLVIENFLKAAELKARFEEIGYKNYSRYHWTLETFSMFEATWWKGYKNFGGYVGMILDHGGDVEAALIKMVGGAEVLADYANDIAATEF